jgi:hypothetical protein
VKGTKVWNGSAWVVKPTKVWSGSAWVEKPAKVWNGSAWVAAISATWQTNASAAVSGANAGWNGYTMRQRIAAAGLANGGGTKVRVTLKAASGASFTIDSCYIGAGAASGDVYDFETTPTQLTFSGGSAGVTVASNGTVLSDEVTYTVDASKPLVISVHFSAASSVPPLLSKTNWTNYNKAAVSEAATVNVSGYATSANAVYLISLVESLV